MLEQVRRSLSDAWNVLKHNWVVLWFPLLVTLGMALLLIMVFAILMQGASAGELMSGGVVAVIVGVAVGAVVAAGQGEMYRGATSGERVTTNHFSTGVRRFWSRFLGGILLLIVIGLVIGVIFMSGLIQQVGYIVALLGTGVNTTKLLLSTLHQTPLALVGIIIFTVIKFFLSMWPVILVVEDVGLWEALDASWRLIRDNLGTFVLLGALNFVVTFLLPSKSPQPLIQVVALGAGLLWSCWYAIALYVLYNQIKGVPLPSFPPPAEELPGDPQDLLI